MENLWKRIFPPSAMGIEILDQKCHDKNKSSKLWFLSDVPHFKFSFSDSEGIVEIYTNMTTLKQKRSSYTYSAAE